MDFDAKRDMAVAILTACENQKMLIDEVIEVLANCLGKTVSIAYEEEVLDKEDVFTIIHGFQQMLLSQIADIDKKKSAKVP